ncbi:unnamed protein product [Clonostachys rhizophaga]|uniref:Uncharacterized protein n=1 Tax=Clonostachys rhizophaga TaxID=160324 RepID=A0A9N9W714_9HYPO|nr:unnamed protein product [Clonostachys rhizophaga]
MANSTSILLLPGSFMPETVYSDVLDAVAKRGIDVRFLPLKSGSLGSGDRREPPNQGKDVIVAASSYASVPLTQSYKGLSKAEREKSGKSEGLVNIGFMPSVVPEIGQAACEVQADVQPENIIPVKGDVRQP